MSTTFNDVIVPELFNPYVVKRTAELSAILNSGIVTSDAEFNRLASEAAPIHNMPFFADLTGESEAVLEGADLKDNKITSNKDVSTTIRRAKMWSATDLAAALAGADPAKAIGDLVAGFWARDRQKELIAILKGVFGSYTNSESKTVTSMADHIYDITTASTAAAKILDKYTITRARALMGDNEDKLTAIVMHSATKFKLEELDLIDTVKASSNLNFDTYQGKRVIVDDSCPVEKDVYTTYLFGEGAIAYGSGNPVGFVPTEIDRDKKKGSGVDYLINRNTYILHPRGIKWTNEVRTNVETPTREELANPQNWLPVYEPKQLRMVAIKHRLA